MPCCKAKQYGWCSELVIAYRDKGDGQVYCVFHAPKDKGQTPDNFNKLVYKRIQDAIDKKEKCDLSGTIFQWDITFYHFDEDNSLPAINFYGATFRGNANFSRATFREIVDFGHATFRGNADFSSFFRKIVDFSDATFRGDAYFSRATFRKGVDFGHATFRGKAYFSRATFSGRAFFIDTTFKGDVEFEETTFSRSAVFTLTTFRSHANFHITTFSGKTYFEKTTFKEGADFLYATFSGETNFRGATFRGYADFEEATFSERAFFNDTTFKGDVEFHHAYFVGEANFRKTVFIEGASFRECSADKLIYFENVDFSRISIFESDPLMMHFTSCRWPQIFGRNALFDEINMKKDKGSFEKIEYLYRRLKQKHKNEHNEPETSNWHYREKEMFRKKNLWRRYFPLSISNLYWISSGYGERPMRAGFVLLLVLIGVSVITGLLGLVPNGGKSVSNILWIHGPPWSLSWKQFGFLIYNTIQNSLFIRQPYFVTSTIACNIFLTLSTKIIIPLQTALFALSVRNRFRR